MRETEQELIGALIMDPDYIAEIKTIVTPEMFTDSRLGEVFYQVCNGVTAGEEIVSKVKGDRFPEQVARQEIANCIRTSTLSPLAPNIARVIRDEYRAKMLSMTLNRCVPTGATVDKCITDLLGSLKGLAVSDEQINTLASLMKIYGDKLFKPKDGLYSIGIRQFDENILKGFERGDLVIIAARPAVGKSAFALDMALKMAREGMRIGYFNAEMTDEQVFHRMLANLSGIPLNRIRLGTRFLDDEEERLTKAKEMLKDYNNLKIHTGVLTTTQIESNTAKNNYDIVMVDYLQKITSSKRDRNRFTEIAYVSSELKELAIKRKIPVIALSQLGRIEATQEPSLSNLRESGQIEQDASAVVFLWMDSKDDNGTRNIKVAKNRQGTLGEMQLTFDGEHMRFYEKSGYPYKPRAKPKEDNDGFMPIPDTEDLPFD